MGILLVTLEKLQNVANTNHIATCEAQYQLCVGNSLR
jgi:hypothetical protein